MTLRITSNIIDIIYETLIYFRDDMYINLCKKFSKTLKLHRIEIRVNTYYLIYLSFYLILFGKWRTNKKKESQNSALSTIKAHALDDQLMYRYICTCNISSLITDNV